MKASELTTSGRYMASSGRSENVRESSRKRGRIRCRGCQRGPGRSPGLWPLQRWRSVYSPWSTDSWGGEDTRNPPSPKDGGSLWSAMKNRRSCIERGEWQSRNKWAPMSPPAESTVRPAARAQSARSISKTSYAWLKPFGTQTWPVWIYTEIQCSGAGFLSSPSCR